MQDPAKQKSLYKILVWVFGIAGLAWIIGGVRSLYHPFLYPFIGVLNLGIAYYCRLMSK